MKKGHVLIKDRILPPEIGAAIIADLEKEFYVHKFYEAEDPEKFIGRFGRDITALVTTYAGKKVEAEFMSRFPNLKIISNFGVGYNNVDAKWAGEHGIVVTNTPDVLTEEVADLAMGLTLATVREIPQAVQFLRDGRWKNGAYPLTASLRGRTMGIIGLGRIGEAIAKRAEAFGVEIIYHGPHEKNAPYKYYASLREMAEACDLLMVAAPERDKTKKMVNAEILKALGENGILINIARGSLVDEKALIAALRGTIHSAGLDVYDNEPNISEELLELPNLVMLPHVASASEKTRLEMAALTVENLELFFQGKPPKTHVPEAPYKPSQRGLP